MANEQSELRRDGPDRRKPPSRIRRLFLKWLLGSGTTALIGATLYPLFRFALPPKATEAATSSVIAGKVGDLAPGAGKVFRFGSRPGILVHTSEGDYKAFSAVCSHLQCTVQYRQDLAQIWCACHNGFFDLKGQVISGPPPEGLEEYRVDVRDEEIVVTRV